MPGIGDAVEICQFRSKLFKDFTHDSRITRTLSKYTNNFFYLNNVFINGSKDTINASKGSKLRRNVRKEQTPAEEIVLKQPIQYLSGLNRCYLEDFMSLVPDNNITDMPHKVYSRPMI